CQGERHPLGALREQVRDEYGNSERGEAEEVPRHDSNRGPNARTEEHSDEPEAEPLRIRGSQTLVHGIGGFASTANSVEILGAQLGRKPVHDDDVPGRILSTLLAPIPKWRTTRLGEDREPLENQRDIRGFRPHDRPVVVDELPDGRFDPKARGLEPKGLDALLVGDGGPDALDSLPSQCDLKEKFVLVRNTALLRHDGEAAIAPEKPGTSCFQAE